MKASPGDVRFGVIGCGVIAYWSHLRELRTLPSARLVAVADPDSEALERARKLTGAAAHEDACGLLQRDDIDAVVISTPTHLHAPLAISAAKAGKHIYVEKPLAASLEDGKRVLAAVRESGVCAVMGFNRRHHPLYTLARTAITKGAIGAVRAVLSTLCETVVPEARAAWITRRATGGGVLLDLASHHIDLARWFLTTEVLEADARIESLATEGDQAWLRLTMNGGIEWRSFFSLNAGRADWIEFIGELGTLRVDRHRPRLSLRASRRWGYGVRSAFLLPSPDVVRWWVRRVRSPSYESSYRHALTAFVESIRGRKTGSATMEDGLRSLEVVLAAERSAGTGRPVSIPVSG